MMSKRDETTKRGWMKKQGGLVRNWQIRWFVLRGQSLDYYAKDDKSKLLGSIDLSGAKIVETPYNRDEPDRWLFDIAPAKGGKMVSNQETYPLWCNDEGERNGWINALRRAIYASRGGGVFGGPLKDVMKYDKDSYQCDVPHVLKQCVEVIAENGLSVEGIFRLSGRLALVKELKRRYDEGERPNFREEFIDVHTAASLLKMYFRELPEPIIPFEHFESFLSLATSFKYNSNHDQTFRSLKKLIRQIPIENFTVLDYLTRFLHEVAKHQAKNKMTENNLSLIFGTNILGSEDNSPEFQMATQNLTTHVVLALVKWHDLVFCDDTETELAVGKADFEELVNLSETTDTTSIIEPGDPLSSAIVSDLVGIDFTQSAENVSNTSANIPPPIPPRVTDTDHQLDEVANNQPVTPPSIPREHPVPTPRQPHIEDSNFVKRRQTSTRRADRPAPVLQESRSPENSCTTENTPTENVAAESTPISKVERKPNNFQSYIDSPLDGRISLNIGDLPSSVEDLQSLVLSLKIQLKEQRREIDQLNMNHKVQVENLVKTIFQERHAKEEAISRIVELTNTLVTYQSEYGALLNGKDEN